MTGVVDPGAGADVDPVEGGSRNSEAPFLVVPGVSHETPSDPDHLAGDQLARNRRARSAVQRSDPSAHIVDTLDLVDEMAVMTRSREQIFRHVESLIGIRFGELQTVTAVAEGADHFREVARRTGQPDAAARVTVEGLVERGLLGRHAHDRAGDGSEPGLIHVSPAGTVVLQQAQALHVRLVDAVVDTLDEGETLRLRESVAHIAETLDPRLSPRLALTPAPS